MESTHEVRQANRVAAVSDALDSLTATNCAVVWAMAQRMHAERDMSFLEAFEFALEWIKNPVDLDKQKGSHDQQSNVIIGDDN